MDSTAPAPAARRSPARLLRNPYFWATVAGLLLIPAMRPLLRFEPAPPPLYGSLSTPRLVDHNGARFELAPGAGEARLGGPVRIVGFFSTRCGARCEPVLEGLSELAERLRADGVAGVEAVAVTVDPERDTREALRDYAAKRNGQWNLRLLTGRPADVRSLLLDFRAGDPRVLLQRGSGRAGTAPADDVSAPAPSTNDSRLPGASPHGELATIASHDRLMLVDRSGGLRGSYSVDAAGLDEVFHRARHVLEERRPPRPARLPQRRGVGRSE